MAFSWKMLVAPAVLIGLKVLKIDYEVPRNVLIIRVLYAVSQISLFVALGLIYQRIGEHGDEKKSVKIKVPSPTGPTEEKRMTYKEYDLFELQKLVKNFGMGAAMTIGIHVYMKVVPALLLQLVTQPITLYDHALFALYILKKDPNSDEKLKRPFPSDSPMAKLEAMKKEMAGEEERQHAAPPAIEATEATEEDEVEEEDPTNTTVTGRRPALEEDTATATGSQPLSRAERRPRARCESDEE